MGTERATRSTFRNFGRRAVVGRFDGGRISSDGGGLLLREVDARLGLMHRLAECFADCRQQGMTEHSVRELVAQRVYGLALGYEDVNDHDALRDDSLLALLVGKTDLTGVSRLGCCRLPPPWPPLWLWLDRTARRGKGCPPCAIRRRRR